MGGFWVFGRTMGVAKGRNSPLQWAGGGGRGQRFLINNTEQLFQTSNTPRIPELYFFSAKASKTSPEEQIFCGTDLMGAPVIKLAILSFPVYITKTNVKSVIDSAVLH